jgi:integrase
VALTTDDLTPDPPALRLGAAHARGRHLPLTQAALRALASYLEERTAPACNSRSLFVRDDGRPLSPPTLNGTVERVLARAEVSVEGAHRLRAFRSTYIYRQLGLGVLPAQVAADLGSRPAVLAPYVESLTPERVTDLDLALANTAGNDAVRGAAAHSVSGPQRTSRA